MVGVDEIVDAVGQGLVFGSKRQDEEKLSIKILKEKFGLAWNGDPSLARAALTPQQ